MTEILKALGLDWKMFLAQLLNFAIFYWLLAKFALPKVREMIKNRQEEIDKGLKQAEEAKSIWTEAKAKEDELIAKARSEASQIIRQGRERSQKVAENLIQEAKQKAQNLVENGEKQVQVAKEKMLLEAKDELAEIISLGVRKVAEKKVDKNEIEKDYLQKGLIS